MSKIAVGLKVVRITPKDASLYQDIVQLLEDIIRRAKEGDSVGTAWSLGAEKQVHKFIGGVESLKFRAIRELLEEE
jgi:hypothetical protein